MIEVLLFGLSTNQGGIETYLKKIWDNIDHTRFHFNFIDMTGKGNVPYFYNELKASGCRFYKVTPRNVSISRNRSDLNRLFATKKFDIFHFNVNTLSYILPVEIALKHGCKVVVHSRNGGASNKLITNILHQINKKRLCKLDINRIAVSALAGDWLFGESKFKVFNNGIDVEKFTFNCLSRNNLRNSLNCSDKTVIGNVGAFLPAKNHRFIIDVFNEYQKINKNSVLWLVGDGYLKEDIESYVTKQNLQNKVLFLGKRNDIPDIYSAMDIFLFPSLFEGFPNAVLEAQCEGLPCIVSDCITKEVLITDNIRAIALSDSISSWVKGIQLFTNTYHNDRKDSAAIIRKSGFSVKDEIKRLESFYISILKL